MAATSRTAAIGDPAADPGVEQDPSKPGRHQARLADSKIRVWLIVGTYQRLKGDAGAVAREWVIPVEEVQAALEYYGRHRDLIDAMILLEREVSLA